MSRIFIQQHGLVSGKAFASLAVGTCFENCAGTIDYMTVKSTQNK